METLWGIDLGGTKIEGAVINAKTFEVISRIRVATEQEKGYQHIIGQISKLLSLMKEETALSPVTLGIGTPGSLDPILGTLKNSNTVCLNGQHLLDDVQNALGIPIKMANDANCFALAETRMGAVPDVCPEATVVFGVIMGTGVGGGVVINNQVLVGRHGIGGEWAILFWTNLGVLVIAVTSDVLNKSFQVQPLKNSTASKAVKVPN